MRKYLYLVVMLLEYCLSGIAQSQTRTATYLNNLNNFQQVFGNQNFSRASAEAVEADDNIYASTKKLSAASRTKNSANSSSGLALQGFGFTIPDDADIENISVKVRRFKKGGLAIKDYFVSVMRRYDCTEGECIYGFMWRSGDVYDGNYYPDTETEYNFLQSGSGNNGGFNHDETYEWTPAMVNHQYFGVRIDSYKLEGRGSVTVSYDLVEVTVNYSIPEVPARKSPDLAETNPLKGPIVYPNPFTTKANIQFTASESGKAVVELYNIAGIKIRTLFSANVVKGEAYNTALGDALMPNGVYVYTISNGKQKHTGKLIKVE